MTVNKARVLRKKSTAAEKLLWSRLRNRKIEGPKFRRQHQIGDRVVDFFCAQAQLAIELDGSGHGHHLAQAEDLDRELELHARGIRLLRFWNSQVLENVSGVVETIIYAIDPEKSPWPTLPQHGPHLGPLPAGEETPAASEITF